MKTELETSRSLLLENKTELTQIEAAAKIDLLLMQAKDQHKVNITPDALAGVVSQLLTEKVGKMIRAEFDQLSIAEITVCLNELQQRMKAKAALAAVPPSNLKPA